MQPFAVVMQGHEIVAGGIVLFGLGIMAAWWVACRSISARDRLVERLKEEIDERCDEIDKLSVDREQMLSDFVYYARKRDEYRRTATQFDRSRVADHQL